MKARVLIVDDEPNLLRLIGYAIEFEGHEPIVAQNGQQGLQKARSERPDLIILDWMLPDISGLQVLAGLRKDPRTTNVPVIMLSARSEVGDKVKGLKAGADEHITKPVDTAELVARAEALLRHTRRLQQSQAQYRGQSIAFIGAKGGVGTSTVALNTAALPAQTEKPVIAVELGNMPGGFGAHLNVHPARTIDDLADVITPEAVAGCLTKQTPSLRILFGACRPDRHTPLDPTQTKEILSALKQMAAYVVVDCSACPGLYTEELLRLADRTFLVLEREPTSVRAAEVMLEVLQAWGIGRHAVDLVLVNRASLAISLNQQEISSTLGGNIASIIPNAGEGLVAAQQRGQPFISFQPQSAVALAFHQLAGRIIAAEPTHGGAGDDKAEIARRGVVA